jgi:hypothetical protein
MNDLERFLRDLHQDVFVQANLSNEETSEVDAFTKMMIDRLSEASEIDDGRVAHYSFEPIDSETGPPAMKVSGYSVAEDSSMITIFFSFYTGESEAPLVPRSEVHGMIERVTNFVEQSRTSLTKKIEESMEAHDLSVSIHEAGNDLSKIRIIILTDGITDFRTVSCDPVGPTPVTCDVWDLTRIAALEISDRLQEPINIDFLQEFGSLIPCLSAPQIHADYSAHLAVIPGDLLAEIFEKYGSRILERNVRSFLQVRGKINKEIRATILSEPERFLAYNNGISATAAGITIVDSEDGGLAIASVEDLQIVNGGQTTAVIHHLAKRDKERDKVDLGRIFVQAKLTVVPPEKLDEIVPKISLYANSQNKVQAADFEANSPFHLAIEKLSREIWTPGRNGEPRTHWFYERARGDYQVVLANQGSIDRQRDWKRLNPATRKFTKTELAKWEHSWDQLPHFVSRADTKNFNEFTLRLRRRQKTEIGPTYFERLIAKGILYKETDRVVGEMDLGGYKINTVTYSIAYISHVTNQGIDLDEIWELQGLPEDLIDLIKSVAPRVREVLVAPASNANVGEWCKKLACWDEVQQLRVKIPKGLKGRLVKTEQDSQLHEDRIVQVLRSAAAPLGKTEIQSGLLGHKISDQEWKKAIGWLVEEERVIKEGSRWETKYRLPIND